MRFNRNLIWALGALSSVVCGAGGGWAEDVVHVYSHRHYEVDKKVNALFTEKTGVVVKVVNAEADQLIERLKSEGANSPADVLITVDAGRMQRARNEGLLQPVKSETLTAGTQAALQDSDGYWYAYALRARVILVAADRVKLGEINDYEDLAKPEWRGRVLVRSSSSSYNQSLMASMVTALGQERALAWAKGVVANLARPPQGGDRDQIKACAAGLADVCVSNTYYFALLMNSPDPAERAAAAKMRLVFPNQSGRGAHVNVSAAGVVTHARHVRQAQAYLEFLVSPEAQELIAIGSHEFPAKMDLTLNPTHAKWGKFVIDTETFPAMGTDQPAAVRLLDAAGWK